MIQIDKFVLAEVLEEEGLKGLACFVKLNLMHFLTFMVLRSFMMTE